MERQRWSSEQLLTREWLVTNGLGGYASGTVGGLPSRRYHGLLIAALRNPLGRMLLLAPMSEQWRMADGRTIRLAGERDPDGLMRTNVGDYLADFRLEMGLPVWQYEVEDVILEKRILMPHQQNTVLVMYRLLAGSGPLRLKLLPTVHFRPHDAEVSSPLPLPFRLTAVDDRLELSANDDLPVLRMNLRGEHRAFTFEPKTVGELVFHIEKGRGYASTGTLWTPGYFRVDLTEGQTATFMASTESWDTILALSPADALRAEHERRRRLIAMAHPAARTDMAEQLVLAADQFLIRPAGRVEDAAWAHAAGDDIRTVIAGYHWFTDWGRDTMISLEGLSLVTGRHAEAGFILRTFAHYVRDGLIPNMFPEGGKEGLYHTADATLWFFHALDRYVQVTGDMETLKQILPTLIDIYEHHQRGTRFGIGVDPKDGLLRQGAAGYQLTWMDAKVDDWVVTPRRGKAVEINALWYNALRLLERWTRELEGGSLPNSISAQADQVCRSFNSRFWYEKGQHLYDVVDGEGGDDPALRPNQIFSISLPNPVLDPSRWKRVLEITQESLLTPVGPRSLAPGHPDYKAVYDGDLRSRDAAYHQGTVWPWLVGPFIDAWLKVYPMDLATARAFLEGFRDHLNEACEGTISEIFDAEAPYWPRGCAAQAWSVAEVLRCWVKTQPSAHRGDEH